MKRPEKFFIYTITQWILARIYIMSLRKVTGSISAEISPLYTVSGSRLLREPPALRTFGEISSSNCATSCQSSAVQASSNCGSGKFAQETGQFDAFTRHLQASRAIRNCDLMSLAKCRSALDPNTWGGATPAAVLVHSHAFKEPSAVRHQLLVELLGNESVNLQSK